MQEVFENIIEKLEELKQREKNRPDNCDENGYGDGEQIYEDGRTQGRYEQIVGIIEIIKQAAEEYNNGWIPSDKPPKDDNFVLLSFENFSLPMVGRYESDGKGGGTYYLGDCDGEDSCIANDLYVNAWQPLPDQYRPCSNDECEYHSGKECTTSERCGGYKQKVETKIQTNADRIRAMTDEELSQFMRDLGTKGRSHLFTCGDYDCTKYTCDDCGALYLDWLQSEVEE